MGHFEEIGMPLAHILKAIPLSAKRILEVGCTCGAALKTQTPGREIWALESSSMAAAGGKAWYSHILTPDCINQSPGEYFDCVLIPNLQTLSDPTGFLKQIKPHLHPDGLLIAAAPNQAYWRRIIGLMQGHGSAGAWERGRWGAWGHPSTGPHAFTPASLRNALWDAGFMTVRESPWIPQQSCGEEILISVGEQLGIPPQTVREAIQPHTLVNTARPRPNPHTSPDRLAALVGPHIGKLGEASKRCSIVIVTYNSASTIDACLNSVIPTLGSNDEVILVDNASQDDTLARLKSYTTKESPITLIKNTQNVGFARGVNQGILVSKGEYPVLLNPDTVVWPQWLERMMVAFKDETVGAVGPLGDNVGGDQFIAFTIPSWTLQMPVDQVGKQVHSSASSAKPTKLLIGFCMMLNRSILNKYGLLEESTFMGSDDAELSWRYQELGLQLMIATNVFVHHRVSSSFVSLSNQQRNEVVGASDRALATKIHNYYGLIPSSDEIWGCCIFEPARARFVASLQDAVGGGPFSRG